MECEASWSSDQSAWLLSVVRKVVDSSPTRAEWLENSLFTQQQMGTWFTSGKVKGGERRGLGPAFHMPCPRHDGALIIAPMAIRLRATFLFKSDSADPNLDCRIGSKVFADGSSQCLASIRKLGNCRRSEGLRCINPSKGTNLAILITKKIHNIQTPQTFAVITLKFVLFVLRLNVPVNNFSVMSGRSHRFLGN